MVAVVAAALLLGGCAGAGDQQPSAVPSPTLSPSSATGFATAADGTRISYRDWGGGGPTLVLLAGLGDTAAVYDDLASRLVDDYRVVGITRRGFGESDRPASGYDYATRVADDQVVLEQLRIDRAVFIGHSIAGDELVGLAGDPRTAGLVFLDAAAAARPTSADTPDCVQAAQLWMPGWTTGQDDPVQAGIEQAQRVFGFPLPDSFAAEVEASYDFEGGTISYRGSPGAIQAIEQYSAAHPLDFTSVVVPALSIAALSDTLATSFPWMTDERVAEQDRDAAQACTDSTVVPAQRENMAAVAAANPGIESQRWDQTHHHLYLQQPERTAATIKDWLAGL